MQHIPTPSEPDLVLLAGLSRPDMLQITLPADEAEPARPDYAFGCNQDWFGEAWQRQAGCGPCTASTILLYLARQHPALAGLYPDDETIHASFVPFMNRIWSFVTPGHMGVHEASILSDGVRKFAALHQIDLAVETFVIPALPGQRQAFDAWIAFLRRNLERDCPVAFLNLSNGRLANLDSWHWVTVTRLFHRAGDLFAEISDSGERKLIDLGLWYRTTRLGGASVSLFPAGPLSGSAG
jgi:hypothetical protein